MFLVEPTAQTLNMFAARRAVSGTRCVGQRLCEIWREDRDRAHEIRVGAEQHKHVWMHSDNGPARNCCKRSAHSRIERCVGRHHAASETRGAWWGVVRVKRSRPQRTYLEDTPYVVTLVLPLWCMCHRRDSTRPVHRQAAKQQPRA